MTKPSPSLSGCAERVEGRGHALAKVSAGFESNSYVDRSQVGTGFCVEWSNGVCN